MINDDSKDSSSDHASSSAQPTTVAQPTTASAFSSPIALGQIYLQIKT